MRKLEWFQSDCSLSAPILSQLQLFQSCCTYFELELKQSDFSCFELTLIISIWLHHFYQESATFFCYALPIFRANFTKQWTLSNQLQFFPAKKLISAWRVVGNLLLINVERDKNSQLFVVLINASQLFDDSSHCIFLMFANICWWWVPLKVYWGSQSLHFCMQKEKL